MVQQRRFVKTQHFTCIDTISINFKILAFTSFTVIANFTGTKLSLSRNYLLRKGIRCAQIGSVETNTTSE